MGHQDNFTLDNNNLERRTLSFDEVPIRSDFNEYFHAILGRDLRNETMDSESLAAGRSRALGAGIGTDGCFWTSPRYGWDGFCRGAVHPRTCCLGSTHIPDSNDSCQP